MRNGLIAGSIAAIAAALVSLPLHSPVDNVFNTATVAVASLLVGVVAVDSVDIAFPVAYQVGTHTLVITGLYPFTLTHCGPSPPCVRFADGVADADATLGTWCLARASRAGLCLRLTQPSLARRSNKRGEVSQDFGKALRGQGLPANFHSQNLLTASALFCERETLGVYQQHSCRQGQSSAVYPWSVYGEIEPWGVG